MDMLDALGNIQKNENEKLIGIRIIKIGDDPIEIQEISDRGIMVGQTEKSIQVICVGHIEAGKTALLEILSRRDMPSCDIILLENTNKIQNCSTSDLMEAIEKNIPLPPIPIIITRNDMLDDSDFPVFSQKPKHLWNNQHKFSAPKPRKGNPSTSKKHHQRKK